MNPYFYLGAVLFWVGSTAGAYFYGHHVADQACTGKVEAVQLQQSNEIAKENAGSAVQAVQAVNNGNAASEKHNEETGKLDERAVRTQARIQVVYKAAAPASCLRAPVDPGLDDLLRHPDADPGNQKPTGAPAG